MATLNPFDLLGDDDAEDPALLLAAQQKAVAPASAPAPAQAKKAPAQAQPPAKISATFPSKPLPPAQAVRESRNEGQRGGRGAGRGGRGGRGYNRDFADNESGGRGGRGYNRDFANNENAPGNRNGFSGRYNRPSEDGERAPSGTQPYDGPRGGGGFRGGRRGGFNNGESEEGERPRRVYDRHSGSGRGNDIKREGSGRGNWGTPTDEIAAPETEEPVNEGEKNVESEKQAGQDDVVDNKESSGNELEEKEPEEKEMTLEEYEKVLEEKRKALLALKSEERKVDLDKELKSMQLLSNKKNNDEIFAKLGSDKEKKKEAADKAKKFVSISEFLKPSEGDNYRAGGRGRGRGRGRGGYNEGPTNYNLRAPAIEDVGQFPTLGGK